MPVFLSLSALSEIQDKLEHQVTKAPESASFPATEHSVDNIRWSNCSFIF